MDTLEFKVGRIVLGRVRDFLKATKFKYGGIEIFESGGWFEHTFIIKGDPKILKNIKYSLDEGLKYESKTEPG